MTQPHLVFLTGAGISADSGLQTFRDAGGIWDQYPLEEVATPEAWKADPKRVLAFYNLRREQALAAEPNAAHRAIAELEDAFHVEVVTQNIDDLHERAGSSRVSHLHGDLLKARSTIDPGVVLPVEGARLEVGDLCPLGSQLRPHVVWFGEEVTLLGEAAERVARADVVVVVGTSLGVYPAAGLIHDAKPGVPLHLVDPHPVEMAGIAFTHWPARAAEGVPQLVEHIRAAYE